MTKGKYAALWAYLSNQEETINFLFDKISTLSTSNEDQLINLSYQFHNLYSAYEDLFKEISNTFENNISDGSGYHRNLIKRMKIAIPEIRPKILSDHSFQVLGELMGFRHVFRHAYSYNLTPEKINLLKDKIIGNREKLNSEINSFKKFLEDLFKA